MVLKLFLTLKKINFYYYNYNTLYFTFNLKKFLVQREKHYRYIIKIEIGNNKNTIMIDFFFREI